MKTAYTYTILRYVHDTATGEFLNVGVALLAPEAHYAGMLCRSTYGRLSKAFPGMDGEAFKNVLRYVQSRFDEIGDRLREELAFDGIPRNVLELAHSVLPPDDSSLQWSPPGSGLTADPSRTLEGIFERMVMAYDGRTSKESRSDEEVWRTYKRELEARRLLRHFKPKTIAVQDDEVQFRCAWKNDVWHCLEPVSLDLVAPESIREKAHKWLGQIMSVKDAPEPFKLYLLLGEPQQEDLRAAVESAVSILGKIPVEKEIVRENDAEEFSERLTREFELHENSAR